MRLTDLSPRWLLKDGRRIGFTFVSPVQRTRSDGTKNPRPWRQTCFWEPTTYDEQRAAMWAACDELKEPEHQHFGEWQPAAESAPWRIEGAAPENASFDTLTITPSIDGSRGGLWHGFITNGEIVGGL